VPDTVHVLRGSVAQTVRGVCGGYRVHRLEARLGSTFDLSRAAVDSRAIVPSLRAS